MLEAPDDAHILGLADLDATEQYDACWPPHSLFCSFTLRWLVPVRPLGILEQYL